TPKSEYERIMSEGLKPNGTPSPDVYYASVELDKLKPAHIPSWVQRSESVYMYPEVCNELVIDDYRKDHVLLAVRLPSEKCWVGDQGWGGFCLFHDYDDMSEEEREAHRKAIRKDYGKKYWKYSASLDTFIRNPKLSYDEILFADAIPSSHITLIGQ